MFSIIDLKNCNGTNILITRPYLAIGKVMGGKIRKFYYFYRLWTPQVLKRAGLIGKIIQTHEENECMQYYKNRHVEVVPTNFGDLSLVLKLYTAKNVYGGVDVSNSTGR